MASDMNKLLEPASQGDIAYPESSHMRLGRGLSSLVKSRHSSCFDMGLCYDKELVMAQTSLSESDLLSLFESSSNVSIEKEKS
jgi:hypothetical protein